MKTENASLLTIRYTFDIIVWVMLFAVNLVSKVTKYVHPQSGEEIFESYFPWLWTNTNTNT